MLRNTYIRGVCRVVESEGLAFEKHTVIVHKHWTVNEFERSFFVILEVADCVESVLVVALRLNLKAQFNGLSFGNLVTEWHNLDGEGIGLLHVKVIGT